MSLLYNSEDASATGIYDEDDSRVANVKRAVFGFVLLAVAYTMVQGALTGFSLRTSPGISASVFAGIVFALLYLSFDRLPAKVAVLGFLFTLYFSVGIFVVVQHLVGQPLESTVYLLLPILATILISDLRASLLAIGIGLAAVLAAGISGWVVTSQDELIGMSVVSGLLVIVALILESRRNHAATSLSLWRDENASLESILASSASAIFRLDKAGQATFTNPVGHEWIEQVTGKSAAGERFWQIFEPDVRNQFEHGLYQALDQNLTRFRFNYPIAAIQRDWEVTFAPHKGTEGVILTVADITDIMQHQRRVDAAKIVARQSTLNLVTHELNTPLMPILLTTHVLQKRWNERAYPEDMEALDMIERNARRAISMVEEVVQKSNAISSAVTTNAEDDGDATSLDSA